MSLNNSTICGRKLIEILQNKSTNINDFFEQFRLKVKGRGGVRQYRHATAASSANMHT